MILSAGVVPVYLSRAEPEFLLLRAYRYWDFPKGVVGAGEEPFLAAIRELREETGLTHAEFPWGEAYIETSPYARGKIARYYLGRVLSKQVALPVSEELGRPEHMQALWLPYAKASALLVPRVRAVLDWAHGQLGQESKLFSAPDD